MKKLILYLIIVLLLSSCATQKNIEKNKKIDSIEQPKKQKDGKVINTIAHIYSFMVIGVIIVVLVVGTKQH